jgi:hypothetical protein
LRGGAALSLPAVTFYTWNLNANVILFDANGAGSSLDLSNLATINFNTGISSTRTATIVAGSVSIPSGMIDLSGWTSVSLGTSGFITVRADGAASTVDIGALTPLPAGVTLDPLNGGTIVN